MARSLSSWTRKTAIIIDWTTGASDRHVVENDKEETEAIGVTNNCCK